jgi:hypothetical protein
VDNVENPNMTEAEENFFKPRFPACTHGMYAFDADGRILARGGGYEAEGTRRLLREALARFAERPAPTAVEPGPQRGRGNVRTLPEGGLAFAVTWKVLGGYETTQPSSTTGDGRYDRQFRESLGSDRLWTTKAEAEALAAGTVAESLARRMARDALSYVLEGDVDRVDLALKDGRLRGTCRARGASEPTAELLGVVETKDGRVTRLDLVAKGWARRVSDCGFSASLLVVPDGARVPAAILFSTLDPASDLGRVPPHRIRAEHYYR